MWPKRKINKKNRIKNNGSFIIRFTRDVKTWNLIRPCKKGRQSNNNIANFPLKARWWLKVYKFNSIDLLILTQVTTTKRIKPTWTKRVTECKKRQIKDNKGNNWVSNCQIKKKSLRNKKDIILRIMI